MINKQDLERLLTHGDGNELVLSVFLDMSVNSDNKRTHNVFLNQKQAQLEELTGRDWREVASAFDRVRVWLETEYDEQNRGVVIYSRMGGDWLEGFQFPVPVQNRAILASRPVITPLAQVLESYHHHGVILIDREHVRILSVYLGTLLDELEVRPDPIDTPHDVQAGGYSHNRYQRHKVEEMRHFFREFAKEVEEFVSRYRPDDLVILGTEENIGKFRDFLPEALLEKVVYTGAARVDENAAEILQKVAPYLEAHEEQERQEVVEKVRDRVAHDYLATAGFQGTLTALQEGKVDTLVIARDHTREGAQCTQCGFVFARELETCPYDGARTRTDVDVVEEMVRMAEGQGVEIAFADPTEVQDLNGVGALLRF
jgi:peptide subunit release factor 1 (eRF1)